MRISKAKAARPLLMAHQTIGDFREILTNGVSHSRTMCANRAHAGGAKNRTSLVSLSLVSLSLVLLSLVSLAQNLPIISLLCL